ncbi:MAG: FecR domain-containing protein [Pseudomonadota bacterium]
MTRNVRATGFFAVIFLVLFSGNAAADKAVGKIFFASGETTIVRSNGVTESIRKNDLVFNRDMLKTADGLLQVKFNDGGFMSLQKHSEMQVEDYQYEGSENGKESAIFSLIRGGLRAISGAIGHARPDRYQLRTEVATIGIRGTAYSALLCSGDCGAVNGRALEDGLHAKTSEGVIFVQNDAGILDVPAGKAAFVPNLNTVPGYTDFNPSFAAILPSAKSKSGKQRLSGAQQARATQTTANRRNDIAKSTDGVKAQFAERAPIKAIVSTKVNAANLDRFSNALSGVDVSPKLNGATPSIDRPAGINDVNVEAVRSSAIQKIQTVVPRVQAIDVLKNTNLPAIDIAPNVSESARNVLVNTNNVNLQNNVNELNGPAGFNHGNYPPSGMNISNPMHP